MFHLIAWMQSEYYNHQFLKSLPDDYNDCTKDNIILDGKNFNIVVYGREGRVPQFHIIDDNNNEVCSISLIKPKYIGNPNRYLNSKEIEDLDKWLENKTVNKKCSNWIIFCAFWESCCFNHEFKYKESKRPNYTLLGKENK